MAYQDYQLHQQQQQQQQQQQHPQFIYGQPNQQHQIPPQYLQQSPGQPGQAPPNSAYRPSSASGGLGGAIGGNGGAMGPGMGQPPQGYMPNGPASGMPGVGAGAGTGIGAQSLQSPGYPTPPPHQLQHPQDHQQPQYPYQTSIPNGMDFNHPQQHYQQQPFHPSQQQQFHSQQPHPQYGPGPGPGGPGPGPMANMPPPQRPIQHTPPFMTGPQSKSNKNVPSPPPGQHPNDRGSKQVATSNMVHGAAATPNHLNSPGNQSSTALDASSTTSAPTTPKTSTLPKIDQDRVAALLSLNAIILRELNSLQSAGANTQPSPKQTQTTAPNTDSGHPSPSTPANTNQPSTPLTATSVSATPASTASTPQQQQQQQSQQAPNPKIIFDNYLRRLQVNIAYLLALSQGKPVPAHPFAMEPPPDSWHHHAGKTGSEEAPLPQPKPSTKASKKSKTTASAATNNAKATAEDFKLAYDRLKELWPNYKRGNAPPASTSTPGSTQS